MSVDELRRMTEEHLQQLVHEIEFGRCIAFVGAGFSFPAKLKGWMDLLKAATEYLPADARNRPAIEATLSKNRASHRELEAVGQLIQDALGPVRFREAVSEALKVDNDALPEAYQRRRRCLLEIPFFAILTTNFDPLLSGKLPTPSTYRRLLRGHPRGPWDRRYWPGHGDPEVVQLHGKVGTNHLVFARRDYRELLFANPGYLTFLKALFATKTVVFMGFSFRDAYVDLLRSELIQLVEPPRATSAEPPALSYGFMTEISAAEARYYRDHEGMRVLYYPPDNNHLGLDDLLERLAGLTNPVLRLAERLSRHHVLWLDPNPKNNRLAQDLLKVGEGSPFMQVRTLDEAMGELQSDLNYELVISHWGYKRQGLAEGQELLDRMKDARVRCPVVFFSDNAFAAENRPVALRWGAADLTSSWVEFFQAIDRILPN